MSASVSRWLAERYRGSRAGRTGAAQRDLIVAFNDLLRQCEALHGNERDHAVAELKGLEESGIVVLERHRFDRDLILKVRLLRGEAERLFPLIGEDAPCDERAHLIALFQRAEEVAVPLEYLEGWRSFCRTMIGAVEAGGSLRPFDRNRPEQVESVLTALPLLLAWEGESLTRFASAQLFGDSKALEAMQSRVVAALSMVVGREVTLEEFGIVENGRSFLLHGPIVLRYPEGMLQIDLLHEPVRIGLSDFRRSEVITGTTRCLLVENAAMLYELAKLRPPVILAGSGSQGGFAHSAIIHFLCALPESVEIWHFGDSDPSGFEILRDLRERSGRVIQSLQMVFRPGSGVPLSDIEQRTLTRLLTSEHLTEAEKAELRAMQAAGEKGHFEQERLGAPQPHWPFYGAIGS